MQKTFLKIIVTLLILGAAATLGNYFGQAFTKSKLKERRERSTEALLEKIKILEVGNKLPNHVFHDMEMKEVELSTIVAGPSVITIISPTCGACEFQLDEVAREIDSVTQKDAIIFISTYHPAKIKTLRDSLNLKATVLYDYGDIYRDSLLVTVFPFNTMVDMSLTITDIIAGPISPADYMSALEEGS